MDVHSNVFCETDLILSVLSPRRMRLVADFRPSGGIATRVTAKYEAMPSR